MAVMSSLNSSIQSSPISVDIKCELLQHFWGLDVRPSNYYDSSLDHDVYFSFYIEQCSDALHDGGRHVSVRTHQDIIQIAEYLKSHMDRDGIKEILSSSLPIPKPANEEEILNGSIDLVARLLLMVEFGCLHYGFSGRSQVRWTNASLAASTCEYFNALRILEQETIKLERTFDARNLGRVAGIEIEWTNNLADHLRLIDGEDERKVAIFHHASFLECQRKG